MRSGGRVAVGLAVAALVASACGGDESAERAQELRRRTAGEKLKLKGIPEDGKVKGNVVELEVSGAGVRIVEPNGDTSGKTAHYHVFVDRDPVELDEVIPVARDVVHAFENPVQVSGLTVGRHEVAVVLGDGNHRRMGEKAATAEFTVEGPSLQVDVPATSPRRQPVNLSVKVEGVTLAEPNGDTSGATGHFAVFVDRDPTAPDAPVPTERGIIHTAQTRIAVPELGNGDHFIWVVLVKGDNTPFDPLVADKVVVQVGD